MLEFMIVVAFVLLIWVGVQWSVHEDKRQKAMRAAGLDRDGYPERSHHT